MSITIVKQGVTKVKADIIVNAANSALQEGGGVCGAIFREAGSKELQEACDKIGYCKTGDAVITPAFNLGAKYIVHAVGPIWSGGNNHEPQLLYNCYKESLQLAVGKNCHSIAFPLISSGIFGYPKDKAWHKAIQACRDFIRDNPNIDLDIFFAVLSDEDKEQGEEILLGEICKNSE